MKDKFFTNLRMRSLALRTRAFLPIVILIVTFFAVQTASFGQATLLSRRQFSRFSVVERARFFEPTISRIAFEEGVDPYLLWAIAYNETRFRPWLRSNAGAEGLMQFIPATAARFDLYNPYQPEPAIRAAARYVRLLQKRFGGRIDSILAGYNAGEGAVDAFSSGKSIRAGDKIINGRGIKTIGGVPPYRETVGYVARGLIIYRLLRARQVFPGAFQMFVYPPAVSQSVARAFLNEPELGFAGTLLTLYKNPIFANAETLTAQNFSTPVTPVEKTVQSKIQTIGFVRRGDGNNRRFESFASRDEPISETYTKNDDEKEKAESKSNEVFYEPRTGARFENRNGVIERLAEGGERIVGEQIRAITVVTSRARGSFFGGSTNSNKSVQK